MRISDWSSDVCSSDLHVGWFQAVGHRIIPVTPFSVQVLGGKGESEMATELAIPVDDDRGEFGIVGPRAPVEVVGADGRPGVVDYAGLGMHVDRDSCVILQAVDRDSVGELPQQVTHRSAATLQLRESSDRKSTRLNSSH